MTNRLKGVFAPITTPFLEDERVDFDGLKRNMEVYANTNISGYLALGSNGENKSLTNQEKFEVLKTIVENKGKDQIVMAGCIFESTYETIIAGKTMQVLGADYLTLLPPSYFKKQMSDDALYRYFVEVADAVDIPCLIYNAPQFCGGLEISQELIKRLSEHPNIVGFKDSSSNNILTFLESVGDSMSVMAGSANFFLEGLLNGATGGIISLANVLPELAGELMELYKANDMEKVQVLNQRIVGLNKIVSGQGGVAAVKFAMDLVGLTGGQPRRPLLPLKEEIKEVIRDRFKEEGII